ncbi:MAG: NAD(P)-dependent alcohol dehydrogenase [Alphaproteobacteria bacterium]|nr:MAG: NAD(P)-dependent alcohol dehydrogenase [Alphaproteobacteria bacterium]
MRAAVVHRYGGPEVVRVAERPDPVPGASEVLIRVAATTVSAADARIRAARFPRGFGLIARAMFGLRRPRNPVLGTEFAGRVVAVGPGVAAPRPGQRVVAYAGGALGGHAELAVRPARSALAVLPDAVEDATAAALAFGGATALHFLIERARLSPGESLLVVGASGAVGSAAVQIGAAHGARVTGVTSGGNAGLVRGLGAEATIDHRAAAVAAWPRGFDVVFDTVGAAPLSALARLVRPGGRLVPIVTSLPQMLGAGLVGRRHGIRVLTGAAPERAEHLRALVEMVAAGRFRPLIGARLPLARIDEAHAIADSGRKRGSVVVTMPG